MRKPPGCMLWLVLLACPLWTSAELTALPNGDRYQGEVTDGVLNGPGLYLWTDGDRYEGLFLNALPHGKGTYTWADGRRYVGGFVQGKRQGQGVLSWPNGDRFTGSFVDNKRHGQGVMKWHTGEVYRGQFDTGAMHGQGTYAWANGNRHLGGFHNDQRSGLGILLQADGTSWSGTFYKGEANGLGIQRRASGEMTLQRRELGQLLEQTAVADNPRCSSVKASSSWMIQADACIDGLAHGYGLAASLKGDKIIRSGRWVLGVLISGQVENLLTPPDTTTADGRPGLADR